MKLLQVVGFLGFIEKREALVGFVEVGVGAVLENRGEKRARFANVIDEAFPGARAGGAAGAGCARQRAQGAARRDGGHVAGACFRVGSELRGNFGGVVMHGFGGGFTGAAKCFAAGAGADGADVVRAGPAEGGAPAAAIYEHESLGSRAFHEQHIEHGLGLRRAGDPLEAVVKSLENHFDLFERTKLGGFFQLFPLFFGKLEALRAGRSDFGENRRVEEFDQASSEDAKIVAALVGLLDQSESIERLACEDGLQDSEKRLAFDQADAVANGLDGDVLS